MASTYILDFTLRGLPWFREVLLSSGSRFDVDSWHVTMNIFKDEDARYNGQAIIKVSNHYNKKKCHDRVLVGCVM